jgi:hypothetical protein
MATNGHKPSDHVLDDFLAKNAVTVPIGEFREVLAELRGSFAAEQPSADREAVAAAIHGAVLNHHWGSSICTEPCRSKHLRTAGAVVALLNGSEK